MARPRAVSISISAKNWGTRSTTSRYSVSRSRRCSSISDWLPTPLMRTRIRLARPALATNPAEDGPEAGPHFWSVR